MSRRRLQPRVGFVPDNLTNGHFTAVASIGLLLFLECLLRLSQLLLCFQLWIYWDRRMYIM